MNHTISDRNLERSVSIIAPPQRLKISEWADAHAQIPPDGNAEPGKYHLRRMPHQAGMLDAVLRPGVREVYWQMASQYSGKTLSLIFIVEYAISVLKRSVLMSRDTRERALEWMRDKFENTVAVTPAMTGLLKDPRKRDAKSTALSRKFPGGTFKIIGSNSPGAFRSTSMGIILQDEVDAYETSKEGDPLALIDRAAETFSNAWKIKCSTPTLEGFSRINAGFKLGDQQYYFLPCPICGEHQSLKWEQVKFSFTPEEHIIISEPGCDPARHAWQIGNLQIRDTARTIYVCEHCHHGWTDAERIRAYMSGHRDNPPVIVGGRELRAEWRATAPFNGIASMHLSGLYGTIGLKPGFKTFLHMFTEKFLDAKAKGRDALMAWVNMFRANTFEDEHETFDWQALFGRAEEWPADELPEQCLWLSFGADIQADRVEISTYGFGPDFERWCLEHRVIVCDFDLPSGHQMVEDYLLNRRWTHPILGQLTFSAGALDCGHQTKVKSVFKFVAKHRLRNWYAVKGFDSALGAIWSPAKERAHGGLVINLNVDFLKTELFSDLRKSPPGPRTVHYRKDLGAAFFQGICSERRMPVKQKSGEYIFHWVKHSSSTRNEPLDCANYAHGAYLVARQEGWISRKWQEVQAELRRRNPPAPVERREVFLGEMKEAKQPELKQKAPGAAMPTRRRIRFASPFSRW